MSMPLHFLLLKGGRLIGRGEIGREQVLIRPSSGIEGPVVLDEEPKALSGALANATVLLQPAIGGLDADGGLADCDEPPYGLHVRPDLVIRRIWPQGEESKPRAELIASPSSTEADGMDTLRRAWAAKVPGAITEDDEGSILEYCKPWDLDGETGSAARRQSLSEHHAWATTEMEVVGKRLNLSAQLAGALIWAISVHDLGKDRPGWQDGVGAPRDGRPYAKSNRRGPGIGNYRHEFGSLRDVIYKEAERLGALDADMQDLMLHLIATHHGRARPSIPAEDEEEIFEEALDQDAFDAALRYIRLQRRWGAWGLAWLEALFRSVDATVSRRLRREEVPAELIEAVQ